MFFMDHQHIISDVVLEQTYSLPLVILSVFIAIISSFSAFGTAERIYNASKKSHKILWNIFGATAMGLGIWAMHFIGMLALSLPVPIVYDVKITFISVLPAIGAASVVLWMLAQLRYSLTYLLLGGLLAGAGIGLMHHIGMAAMRMNASMHHDPLLFYLSLIEAVVIATIALKIQQKAVSQQQYQFINKAQVISAIVMGLATSSMHYTAMMAVDFSPIETKTTIDGLSVYTLTIMVGIVVLMILILALLLPHLLRYKQTISELARLISQEKEDKARIKAIIDSALDASIRCNVRGEIIDWSARAEDIFGWSDTEVSGKLIQNVIIPERYREAHMQGMARFLATREKSILNSVVEIEGLHRDGHEIPIELTVSAFEIKGGYEFNAFIRDITESKQQQSNLEKMAHYDVLTQLPNRTLFADRFSQAIAHSKRNKTLLAVCFLDLDNFKPINDNYGHEVGDLLLIGVAKRISASIREEDTVSRQGGDEFALLLGDVESLSQCEQLLERIQNTLAQPYVINDYPHKITASTGVTLYPTDDADIDTLMRHADQAMYQAKLAGRNRYHFFNTLDDQQKIQRHHKLDEIRHALSNNEMHLYYQPKVNMKTGEIFGAEALIRWLHPEKGLIPPLDFLPTIEGTDLEIILGGWVINTALTQLDYWQQQGIKLQVSINISSQHLLSGDFFDQLNEALDKHPTIDSQYLQLEILESSALGDIGTISGIIKSCQNVLGVDVALDDFGTGYSSLAHIRNLSANTIKIDQTFVRDLLDDPSDYSIIEGVIGLAQAFNREVIAEGVESESHGLMLLIMGCRHAQGYGISRPIPADDVAAWIANYKPNQLWINFAKKPLPLHEQKIMLIRLTTERWFRNLNKVLLTKNNDGSMDVPTRCHLGVWIDRLKKEELFDDQWITQIEHAHNDMFGIASELLLKHQKDDREAINEYRLNSLKTSFGQVNIILDEYVLQPIVL